MHATRGPSPTPLRASSPTPSYDLVLVISPNTGDALIFLPMTSPFFSSSSCFFRASSVASWTQSQQGVTTAVRVVFSLAGVDPLPP